jgi:hypothetical protein
VIPGNGGKTYGINQRRGIRFWLKRIDFEQVGHVAMRLRLRLFLLMGFSFCSFACSKIETGDRLGSASDKALQARSAFAPLLGRIWRVSNTPYGPASGSIYIFLPNGTLLETSCVETYRVAVWSVDQSEPDTLRVVEDQQAVFTLTLGESTTNTWHLHKKLLRSAEVQDLILSAVDSEFVCSDLRK